eukprot:GSMAST32.ASY1.ANO1.1567.1 assembled CDS
MNLPRVVIVGSGWAGNVLARGLNKAAFDVRVISPANHFLFTPLLPSTAVGTLEFRAIQEPVRTIKGLSEFYQAKARTVDTSSRVIRCEDIFKSRKFDVKYDILIIATGCKTNTFEASGVLDREGDDVYFLKHLYHARQIRQRILECMERATNPVIDEAERDALLSFVIVGGGATSCEFTTELSDFVNDDLRTWYPDLAQKVKLTIIEAGPRILGSFDAACVEQYDEELVKRGITVMTETPVTAIKKGKFSSDEIPFGMMVWSAGLAPVKFVENLQVDKVGGRIVVDNYLRAVGTQNDGRIFAVGDCAATQKSSTDSSVLPPTASSAEQQGEYLIKCFNDRLALLNKFYKASPAFRYVERAAWRSTYWTKQLSYSNMVLIPMYWFKAWIFGRDISRF